MRLQRAERFITQRFFEAVKRRGRVQPQGQHVAATEFCRSRLFEVQKVVQYKSGRMPCIKCTVFPLSVCGITCFAMQ